MKHLFLMRHGETEFNLRYKVQGWCDSPLTENGIAQAKRASRYFKEKGIEFDHAYSSSSERACDTCEIASGMEYIRRKDLRERHYGSMEGESRALSHCFPNDLRDDIYIAFGGESYETVEERIVNALREIMTDPTAKSVLCVSHGETISVFLRYVTAQNPLPKDGIENCSVLEFDFDGTNFKYVCLHDTQSIVSEEITGL